MRINGYVEILQDTKFGHGRIINFGCVVTRDLNLKRYISNTGIPVHNFIFKSHLIFGSPHNMEDIDTASIDYNLHLGRLVLIYIFLAIQDTTYICMTLEGFREPSPNILYKNYIKRIKQILLWPYS